MKMYEAIKILVDSLDHELIIAANGFVSRELYCAKDSPKHFYMLGSMGLASSIGLGLAISTPGRRILVLDGDGNILMNLGSLATIGYLSPENLIHVVLDNESHESTGGQPTASGITKLDEVAKAANFRRVEKVDDPVSLKNAIEESLSSNGPSFILVKIEKGIKEAPRVPVSPIDIKNRFVKNK